MREAIAKRWVSALRNTRKYKQCYEQLHNPFTSEFDALGVLCDISLLGYWEFGHYCIGEKSEQFIPPERVWEWSGMHTPVGQFPINIIKDFYQPLAHPDPTIYEMHSSDILELNDVFKLSFGKIANFIKKNWVKL